MFDVEDLLELLDKELVSDLCVIAVPEEMNYADHIIIGTGMSNRQMLTVCATIRKIVCIFRSNYTNRFGLE